MNDKSSTICVAEDRKPKALQNQEKEALVDEVPDPRSSEPTPSRVSIGVTLASSCFLVNH